MIADDDGLGASDVDRGEELEHGLVVGHPGFIDQDHGALVEGECLVLARRQTSEATVRLSMPLRHAEHALLAR